MNPTPFKNRYSHAKRYLIKMLRDQAQDLGGFAHMKEQLHEQGYAYYYVKADGSLVTGGQAFTGELEDQQLDEIASIMEYGYGPGTPDYFRTLEALGETP